MKYTSLVLFLIIIGLSAIPAAHAQQTKFDDANQLLQDSRFSEALTLYKEIENGGHESGALWLNMGISYSQLDSLGMSKYYFLRALDHPETESHADEALQFVNNRFSYQSAVLPQLPWIRILDSLSRSPGIDNLTLVSFFFLYAGTALLIISWFRKNPDKILRYGYLSAFLLAFLILSMTAIIQYQENRYGTGVVVAREGQVYQDPDESSAAVNRAYEGYKLRVDRKESDEYDNWYSVRLENGMYGWIREHYVKVF